MFDNLTISSIPLIVIVFGLVEFAKYLGLTGKPLTLLSLALGCVLYFLFTYSTSGLPANFSAWLNVVLTGFMFGLTASGIYDFANKRLPKVT